MSQQNTTELRPIAVHPGEGRTLSAFGDTIEVTIEGPQTGGTMAVGLSTSPPGGGPPLHVHHNEDELFLILEGRFACFSEGRWTEVGPGAAVFLPRGVPHTYRVIGDTPGRYWVITSPSGFETFFGKCAAVFAASAPGAPPDVERIGQICGEHGIEILGPPPSEPGV